ncbi:hypothetical protein IFM51744_06436 [Aspergillus udagawae]|nr:hypothetical protein IFM51744_06436 [Aspergillus udagawae]GFG04982.1 hypothetical protein IFM5058_02195 [Aspergillus udagawae]
MLKFEEIEYEGEYVDSRYQGIDQDCTLEDVTLLREIAAQWKRDQWQAISARFNGMTGRKITPEQAKSVLDNNQGSNVHRMESSRSDGNQDRIRTKTTVDRYTGMATPKTRTGSHCRGLGRLFVSGSSIH